MAGVLKPSPGALRIIDDLEGGLAIVVNGNTAPKNIAAGQYLFIKNHSTLATGGYHATAAISSGGTISSSNVAADADGIANSINSKIDTALDEVKIVQPVSNKFTLGNGFRGFLFASSAYANAAGLMEVYSNSSGEVTTRIYFGTFTDITFNTSVNGELSYATSRYVEMRLMRFE